MSGTINNGIGSQLQIGKETTYGTGVAGTELVNFLSESIKLMVTRKQEESLLASKAAGAQDLFGRKVNGDFAVILKPENLFLLAIALGLEAANPALDGDSTLCYLHTLTCSTPNGQHPSFTAIVDRKAAVKSYPGCKIDSMKLDAKSGDYIRATFTVKAKDEAAGTLATGLTIPTKRAFKFLNGTLTVDGTSFANISGLTLSLANKLTDLEPTLETGLVQPEPVQGLREIGISVDAYYDAAAEALRENKFKAGALCAISMTFESPDEVESGHKYRLTIDLPNVDITQADANVGGRDVIKVSINGTALQIGSTEPITVKTYDAKSTKY